MFCSQLNKEIVTTGKGNSSRVTLEYPCIGGTDVCPIRELGESLSDKVFLGQVIAYLEDQK